MHTRTLTNLQCHNVSIALQTLKRDLAGARISGLTRIKINRLFRVLLPIGADYQEVKDTIIDQYALKDDNGEYVIEGGEYVISSKEGEDELNRIAAEKNELQLQYLLSDADFAQLQLTDTEAEALEVISEVYQADPPNPTPAGAKQQDKQPETETTQEEQANG